MPALSQFQSWTILSFFSNCLSLLEWKVSAASTGKSHIFNDDESPAKSFDGDKIAYTEQRESSTYEEQAAGKKNSNDRDKNLIQRHNLRSSKGKSRENGTSIS